MLFYNDFVLVVSNNYCRYNNVCCMLEHFSFCAITEYLSFDLESE